MPSPGVPDNIATGMYSALEKARAVGYGRFDFVQRPGNGEECRSSYVEPSNGSGAMGNHLGNHGKSAMMSSSWCHRHCIWVGQDARAGHSVGPSTRGITNLRARLLLLHRPDHVVRICGEEACIRICM